MKRWFLRGVGICTIVVVGACAAPSKKPISSALLVGSWDNVTSAAKLKGELTRGWDGKMVGTPFMVEATLYSDALVEAEESERAKQNLDGPSVLKANIERKKESLVQNKICFLISLRSGGLETTKFSMYRAKVSDGSGVLHELVFSNTKGVNSVPNYQQGSMTGYDWENVSVACSEKPIARQGDLSLFVIPQASNQAKAEMTWQVK